jgi:inhibitor of cysteine peptidase
MRSRLGAGKLSAGVLAGGVLCAVLAGCGSSAASGQTASTMSPGASAAGSARAVTVGAMDDGHQLRVTRGEVLAIKLESNPSTGYSWAVLKVTGHALREEGKASYEPMAEATPVPGSGGTQTFRFTAVTTGAAKVELAYRRPWEKNVKPAKTFTVVADVH